LCIEELADPVGGLEESSANIDVATDIPSTNIAAVILNPSVLFIAIFSWGARRPPVAAINAKKLRNSKH
jgi:hypothetical protein